MSIPITPGPLFARRSKHIKSSHLLKFVDLQKTGSLHARAISLSAKYDPKWVRDDSLGENARHLAESLCDKLRPAPGMNVLDSGCGKAITSIFLAREFGVTGWAIDNAISARENQKRTDEAWLNAMVFPLLASAMDLPLEAESFDAIVATHSYLYYGVSETTLPYLLHFLNPCGNIGIVDVCFTRDVSPHEAAIEMHELRFEPVWSKMRARGWWRALWERSGLVRMATLEYFPGAKLILDEYLANITDVPERSTIEAVLRDPHRLGSLFRMVRRRNAGRKISPSPL